jgi:hypothetical protein
LTYLLFSLILLVMPLGLATSKTRFRYDSPIKPEITPSGITNIGKLRVGFDLYETVTNAVAYEYDPPNQTDTKTIELRNVLRPAWDLGANVSLVSSDPKKSTANSNSGASFSALDPNCSIEGKIADTGLICGVSLQTGTVSYDKASADVEHALMSEGNGYVAVYELGVRLDYTLTRCQTNDIILIDKQDTVVRYLLVRGGAITILRQTRSKLTDGDIKGVLILYSIDAQLTEAYVYENEKTSLTLETFGVLENFQDWFNDFSTQSTAETLLAQDNTPHFTFPNGKKRIRVLNATRNVVSKTDARTFQEFFDHHGIEKDFIFVDQAKKDVDNEATWFWAKFASPFGNKTRPSCLAAETAIIQESFKKDVIPLEGGTPDLPTGLALTVDGLDFTAEWDENTNPDYEIVEYILELSYV